MNKKECPSCAMEIDASEEVCPICGYEMPKGRNTVKWVAIILLLLFIWPLIKLLVNFLSQ